MSKDDIAGCLAYAYAVYTDPLLRVTQEDRTAAIKRLGDYHLLTAHSIALTVKETPRRVRKETGRFGNAELNPAHIPLILGLLSGRGTGRWMHRMVEGGTNVATIAHLLGASRSTIYRRMEIPFG